jgi:hypothetical protein
MKIWFAAASILAVCVSFNVPSFGESIPEMQAKLAKLKIEVAQLEAEITTAQSATQPAIAQGPVYKRTLEYVQSLNLTGTSQDDVSAAKRSAQDADIAFANFLSGHHDLSEKAKAAITVGNPWPEMPEDLVHQIGGILKTVSETEHTTDIVFAVWGVEMNHWRMTITDGKVTFLKQVEWDNEYPYVIARKPEYLKK